MKNKRGIFFTSLAIVIISLFAVSYALYSNLAPDKTAQKRVESMNSFVFSIKEDISRQNYISGYRSLLALQSYITGQGGFIPDSKESIREALLNGSIGGLPMPLMEGFKLQDWNDRVSQLGSTLGITVNYTLINVTVKQIDPWNIQIEANITLLVQDKTTPTRWNLTEAIFSDIGIDGFEDPLYLIGTNGTFPHKISRSKTEGFVQGTDVSNLSAHLENSSYIASPDAPSFLERLEGKYSASPNGIESLVNLEKLSDQGVALRDKSVVDHIYFSSANPTTFRIQGMPDWFKLDSGHLSTYEVQGLAF